MNSKGIKLRSEKQQRVIDMEIRGVEMTSVGKIIKEVGYVF